MNSTGALNPPPLARIGRFNLHRLKATEEFLKHYHRRSNSESVFSAVKRKFGHALRSKTRTAQVNELLCRFLANNLCVLIQEQEELGIVPEFWGDESDGEELRAILKFPG